MFRNKAHGRVAAERAQFLTAVVGLRQTGAGSSREEAMKKSLTALALLALGTTPAWAGELIFGAFGVPSLDEGGLVALVALVGVVGGLIARRRFKK